MRATEGLEWFRGEKSPESPFTHFEPTEEDKKLRPQVLRKYRRMKKAGVTLFDNPIIVP